MSLNENPVRLCLLNSRVRGTPLLFRVPLLLICIAANANDAGRWAR